MTIPPHVDQRCFGLEGLLPPVRGLQNQRSDMKHEMLGWLVGIRIIYPNTQLEMVYLYLLQFTILRQSQVSGFLKESGAPWGVEL